MSIIRDGWSDELDLSSTGMLDLNDELACFHLRVTKCLSNIVDGAERHPDDYQSDPERCHEFCGSSP
jgi:hypothetical protein